MSNETRGHAIKSRRLAHGIKSLREFAGKTGVDREAIGKAEAGQGSTATYDRLEAWLDNFDVETGTETAGSTDDDLVEFRVSGNFGVSVFVKGPVKDLPALEDSVVRLIGRMGKSDGSEPIPE